MTFSIALSGMRIKKRVRLDCWPVDRWIQLSPVGGVISYHSGVLPPLAWLPTQEDILSERWEFKEGEAEHVPED